MGGGPPHKVDVSGGRGRRRPLKNNIHRDTRSNALLTISFFAVNKHVIGLKISFPNTTLFLFFQMLHKRKEIL